MAEQTLPDPKEQTLPDPNDLYRKVLADVKKAGVTEPVAEQIADAISIDLLGEMRSPGDVDDPGKAPSEATVAELRAIAEGLREERERLEWTATQVAHLIRPRRSPSIDPDPTPPGEPPPSVVRGRGRGRGRAGQDGHGRGVRVPRVDLGVAVQPDRVERARDDHGRRGGPLGRGPKPAGPECSRQRHSRAPPDSSPVPSLAPEGGPRPPLLDGADDGLGVAPRRGGLVGSTSPPGLTSL